MRSNFAQDITPEKLFTFPERMTHIDPMHRQFAAICFRYQHWRLTQPAALNYPKQLGPEITDKTKYPKLLPDFINYLTPKETRYEHAIAQAEKGSASAWVFAHLAQGAFSLARVKQLYTMWHAENPAAPTALYSLARNQMLGSKATAQQKEWFADFKRFLLEYSLTEDPSHFVHCELVQGLFTSILVVEKFYAQWRTNNPHAPADIRELARNVLAGAEGQSQALFTQFKTYLTQWVTAKQLDIPYYIRTQLSSDFSLTEIEQLYQTWITPQPNAPHTVTDLIQQVLASTDADTRLQYSQFLANFKSHLAEKKKEASSLELALQFPYCLSLYDPYHRDADTVLSLLQQHHDQPRLTTLLRNLPQHDVAHFTSPDPLHSFLRAHAMHEDLFLMWRAQLPPEEQHIGRAAEYPRNANAYQECEIALRSQFIASQKENPAPMRQTVFYHIAPSSANNANVPALSQLRVHAVNGHLLDHQNFRCNPSVRAQYVLTGDGEFYLYPLYRVEMSPLKPQIHAGSFFGGGVLCAGNIEIENGKVSHLDNDSPYYRPGAKNLALAYFLLREQGVLQPNAQIKQVTWPSRLARAAQWCRIQKNIPSWVGRLLNWFTTSSSTPHRKYKAKYFEQYRDSISPTIMRWAVAAKQRKTAEYTAVATLPASVMPITGTTAATQTIVREPAPVIASPLPASAKQMKSILKKSTYATPKIAETRHVRFCLPEEEGSARADIVHTAALTSSAAQ